MSLEAQLLSLDVFVGQLPAPGPGEFEKWVASAMIVGGAVLLWMRVMGRKPGGEYVSREEFSRFRGSVGGELSALRDRIDSRHLAVVEAIEKLQASLLTEGERRAASLHRRLGEMEAGLARLDERTKHQLRVEG